MSHSSLYIAYRTTPTLVNEYQNGHLSAAVLWDYLDKVFLNRTGTKGWLFQKDNKPLWSLYKNISVPKCIRAAHLFTFDHAIIPKENKDEFGQYFIETHEILSKYQPGFGSNWNLIGEDLIKIKVNKKAIGFLFTCTSVGEEWHHYRKNQYLEEFSKCYDIYKSLDLSRLERI